MRWSYSLDLGNGLGGLGSSSAYQTWYPDTQAWPNEGKILSKNPKIPLRIENCSWLQIWVYLEPPPLEIENLETLVLSNLEYPPPKNKHVTSHGELRNFRSEQPKIHLPQIKTPLGEVKLTLDWCVLCITGYSLVCILCIQDIFNIGCAHDKQR